MLFILFSSYFSIVQYQFDKLCELKRVKDKELISYVDKPVENNEETSPVLPQNEKIEKEEKQGQVR